MTAHKRHNRTIVKKIPMPRAVADYIGEYADIHGYEWGDMACFLLQRAVHDLFASGVISPRYIYKGSDES